jgi:hypothetical protein
MNYGLHIIDTPAGRYVYVGSVPAALCSIVPASKADVMGGRAYANVYGDMVTAKPLSFASYGEAWDAAVYAGFEPIHDGRGF